MLRDLSWFLEWPYLQIFWISWSIFQMRFHWLKILFSSVKFFLLLGFTQYWLRGNCCGEIGLNGVLNMAFLLENKIIFPSVYHLWFNIASGKCPISTKEVQIRTPHWQYIHHQVEGILLTQHHRDSHAH